MSGEPLAVDRRTLLKGLTLGVSAVPGMSGVAAERAGAATQESGAFAPPPARNASQVGAGVFSHSGELIVTASDLSLPGRGGVAPSFDRRYRSSVTDTAGDFGKGFTWTYSRQLVRSDEGIVYDNGHGERYVFEPRDGGAYTNDMLYAVLAESDDGSGWALRGPGGRVERFEPPGDEGRLVAIEDRNGNAVGFEYADSTVTVTGPRGRETTVSYADGLIDEIEDYAGRTVSYQYDGDDRLQTVELANGGTKEYEWTDRGRLATVTAPGKDRPYLENTYDDRGRVTGQRHGTGEVTLRYEPLGEDEAGFPVYRTAVAQKGAAEPNLRLDHNATGQVTSRVFEEPVETERTDGEGTVRTMAERDLSAAEVDTGVARIETRTTYNDRGEWIRREFPEGGVVEQTFDADASDPRDRGNLLEHRHLPDDGRPTDHGERVISAEYGPFQRRTSLTDARGNTTTFEYDDSGNLIRKTHPEVEVPDLRSPGESRTEQYTEEWTYNEFGQPVEYRDQEDDRTRYEYYPAETTYAIEEVEFAAENGGPLARVRRERGLAVPTRVLGPRSPDTATDDYVETYGYDALERVTTFRDGNGNEATHEYDAHGNPVETVDRGGNRTEREFDPADNLLGETQSFTRYVEDGGEMTERETLVREFREYNLLNNVVAFGQAAIENEETVARRETTLDRDVNENVVRRTYPDDVTDTYTYSRRGKRVETRAAAGTDSEGAQAYRFRRDGQERARIDAEGYRLTKEYDGFGRLLSVSNPDDVRKRRVYDEANNLRASYLLMPGETSTAGSDAVAADGGQVAMVAQFNRYDSNNRCNGGRTTRVGCQGVDPEAGGDTTGGFSTGGSRSSGCGGDSGPGGNTPGVNPDQPPGGGDPGDPYGGRVSGFSGVEGETNVVVERDGRGDVRRSFNEDGNGQVSTFTRDGAGNVVAVGGDGGNATLIQRDGNGRTTTVQRQGREGEGSGLLDEGDGGSLQTGARRPIDPDLRTEPAGTIDAERLAGGGGDEPAPDGGSLYETAAPEHRRGRPRQAGEADSDPPLFVRTEIVRDEKDRPVAAFRNDRFLGSVEYDAFDRVRQIEDIEGSRTRALYDGLGRQVGTAGFEDEREAWLATSLDLDPMGRVTAATDPEGRTVEFERDASGRVTSRTNPDGTTVTRTYNDNGQVTGLEDPNGIALGQEFDGTNRLRERTTESRNGVRTEQ